VMVFHFQGTESKSRRVRLAHAHIIFRLMLAALLTLILGHFVMWLWNAVVPPLLLLRSITYWQSVGLLLLIRILFGGLGHREHGFARLRARHAWRDYEEWWREVGKQSFQEFSGSHSDRK
jgi:hypothetical protein